MIDIEKIKTLLASSATGYDIELKTGISRTQIGNYRKDPKKIMKMSLENALKLQNYYEEMEKMNKRHIILSKGKYFILTNHQMELRNNPQRVSSPMGGLYKEPKIEFEYIKEVTVTPEIEAFEKVKDKINLLAASKEQELYYDEYNDLHEKALLSVGIKA